MDYSKSIGDKHLSFEDAIEQFEFAWSQSDDVSLANYLPSPESAWYQACLVELIRIDLEFRWDRGDRRHVETYQAMFPATTFSQEDIAQLAFEEYRVRYRHGDSVSKESYGQRWSIDVSQWPTWVATSDDRVGTDSSLTSDEDLEESIPQVGERFHGFDLIGTLGTGAFGSVFLARQQDLANRFVALKVTEASDVEPFSLAQLQHTNIIPIYSLKRGKSLQSICMPFLGVATMRDLLSFARSDGSHLDSGKAMISTVAHRRAKTVTESISTSDSNGDQSPVPLNESWKRQGAGVNLVAELNDADYLETVLWLNSRIADGLAYAHSRGVVHGDLKPANILIGDDAEPKILDFHLAHASTHDLKSTLVGGTLPYMSAEHLRSYDSEGQVEPHCDLFSLGVIFYESVTGHLPFPTCGVDGSEWLAMLEERQQLPDLTSSPALRQSPAIASMIAKCLDPELDHRYRSVDELKTDLDRHRNDLPLLYAPNVSWVERGRKWARRHPKVCSLTSAGLLFGLMLTLIAVWVANRLGDSAKLQAIAASEAFVDDIEPLQSQLLGRHPSYQSPEKILAVTDKLQAKLNRRMGTIDQYRRVLESLPSDVRNREVGELCYSQYLLAYYLAKRLSFEGEIDSGKPSTNRLKNQETQIRESVKRIEQALALNADIPQPALVAIKADLLNERGARNGLIVPEKPDSVTGQNDELLHSIALLDAARLDPQGRGPQAIEYLSDLIGRDPGNDRAWMLLGRAYSINEEYERSELCYTMSAKLAPSQPWSWVHRGIDRLARGRHVGAELDLSTAISLDSDEPSHYLNRALARIGQGKFHLALEDLDHALQRDAVQTRVHLLRSQTLNRLGETEQSAEAMATFLRLTPVDETSWIARGLARIRSDDVKGALSDFESARHLNPRSVSALQNIATVQAEYLDANLSAIETMSEIVSLKPDDLVARVTRGVLYARQKNRQLALADVGYVLKRDGSADILYRAAGVFSLLSSATTHEPRDRLIALDLLSKASLKDPIRVMQEIHEDPDLKPIRDLPSFQAILDSLGRIQNPQQERRPSDETK